MYNVIVKGEVQVKTEVKMEIEDEVKSEGSESTQTTCSRRKMEPVFVSRPSTLVSKKGLYRILICYPQYICIICKQGILTFSVQTLTVYSSFNKMSFNKKKFFLCFKKVIKICNIL